jgi:2-methylisocitrate lyase-like PEP mutase family enzyme
MMEEKLVTIATFTDYIEAELAKQTLEDFGIKSILTGQNVACVYGGVLGLIDLELQTFENQAQRAREILESKRQQEQ